MGILSGKLPHTVTVWDVAGIGNSGEVTFSSSSPRTISARWQDSEADVPLGGGKDKESGTILYAEEEIALGSYIALGDLTASSDPRGLDASRQVRMVVRSPSLSGLDTLYKHTC